MTDADGETSTATVLVRVNLPVAGDDAYVTTAGTPLAINAPGVLVNDTSPFGDPLTAGYPSDPAGGSVVLNPDGSFIFTPDPGFIGTDTFTYLALTPDGRPSLPAAVTITVDPPNEAPVAADDAYTTTEGAPLTVGAAAGVLGNDTDPDGDMLSAGSAGDPAGGTVALDADGSFTYTPDAGFVGTDTFSYTISDGKGGSDTATVTVVVIRLVVGPPTDANDCKKDGWRRFNNPAFKNEGECVKYVKARPPGPR